MRLIISQTIRSKIALSSSQQEMDSLNVLPAVRARYRSFRSRRSRGAEILALAYLRASKA